MGWITMEVLINKVEFDPVITIVYVSSVDLY